MHESPVVSVAIIAYQHQPFIRQALESVLSQRRDFPIEIVVSDDRSADGTAEIIDTIQAVHPELFRRIDPPANVGMNRNLKRVWEACRGDYIALLEGDDWWHADDKLAVQLAFMREHPSCVLSGHPAHTLYADGTPPEDRPIDWPELASIDLLIKGSCFPTSSVMCRRGVVPQFPDWALDLGMGDWPINLLHAAAGDVGFINRSMSTYRMHAGGTWSPLKRRDRLTRMLNAAAVMQKHFPATYHTKFEAAIGHLHFLLFQACRDDADFSGARSHLLASSLHKFRGRDIHSSMFYSVPLRLLFPRI